MMAWNYRGAVKPSFANYSKSLIRQYDHDICYFLETHVVEAGLQRVSKVLGQHWNVYIIPSQGLTRGIIVIWKKYLDNITFTHSDNQVIFGIVTGHHITSWMVGFIYANTNGVERMRFWSQVEIVLQLGLLLIILGDFNCILNKADE